jgi:hypothetical protein
MKNKSEQRFLTAMRGLRNTLASAVDQLDVILDLAEEDAKTEVVPKGKGECPHPMSSRVPKAVMGHPTRFHCTTCGQDVEE